jgi:D-sedoheptulose 7-phosphate isomerase
LALDIDGVLTDGRVLYTSDGQEQKFVSFRDIDAIFEARRCGLQIALITGENTPWVEFISRRLQVEHTIRGAKDKLDAVRNLAQQLQVPLTAICYVGDSDRDAPALAAVGLGVAPTNATARAKASARLVLRSAGGDGAVQEALACILEQKGSFQNLRQRGEDTAVVLGGLDLHVSIQRVQHIIAESVMVQQAVSEQLAPVIAKAANVIAAAIRNGHKLLIFGNGGSAADAQHMAAELVGRFEMERVPFAAMALTTDTSVLTALVNDYTREVMFARQIEGIGQHGDVAVAISTSGNSSNVLEGVYAAQRLDMQTISLTGRTGGKLADLVDLCLCVPSGNTARIQEAHGLIIHLLCGLVEANIASVI